jgi:hypothetical protein
LPADFIQFGTAGTKRNGISTRLLAETITITVTASDEFFVCTPPLDRALKSIQTLAFELEVPDLVDKPINWRLHMHHHDSNLMIKHGIFAMLVALAAGMCLIFSMIGGISLSPVPVFIEWKIPGTVQGWRAVHIGMLMNGLMAILLGITGRFVVVSNLSAAIVCWGTIVAVWGNFCFYLFGMFAPNHGLTTGANQLGDTNLAALLAFFPAFLGIFTLSAALIVLLGAKTNSIRQAGNRSAEL